MSQYLGSTPLQSVPGLVTRGQSGPAPESAVVAELQEKLERVRANYAARRYAEAKTDLEALISELAVQQHYVISGSLHYTLLLASALCLRGRLLWRDGSHEAESAAFQEATELFAENEAAIATHQYNNWLYTDYGIALHRLGRHHEALRVLDRAVATGAAPAESFGYRGYAYFELGDMALAEGALRKGLQLSPGDKVLTCALADTLAISGADRDAVSNAYCDAALAAARLGDMPEARRLLLRALEFSPTDPQAMSYAVQLMRSEQDLAAAFEVVERALEKDPGHAWALGLKALVQRDGGKFDEALETLSSIDVHTADLAWVLAERARILNWVGPEHNDEALAILARLRELVPEDVDGLLLAAEVSGVHDIDGAIALLRRALELDANSVVIRYELALQLERKSDFVGALEALDEVVRLDRTVVPAYRRKASIMTTLGQRAEAADLLRRAVRLRPGDATILGDLVETILGDLVDGLIAERHVEEALAEIQRELDRDPQYWNAHWLRGLLLRQSGSHAEAVEALSVASRIKPDDVGLQVDLGETLRRQDDYDAAGEVFDRALGLDPDSAVALLAKSGWLCDTAAYAEASVVAERAVAAAPATRPPYVLLGDTLRYMDPPSPHRAEAAFRRASEIDPESIWPPIRLATLLVENGRRREGENLAKGLIVRNLGGGYGTDGDAVPVLAWCYYIIGNYDEALRLLQSWNASGDDLASQFDRALALLACGREAATGEYVRVANAARSKHRLGRRGLLFVALRDLVVAASEERVGQLGASAFGVLFERLRESGLDIAPIAWLGASFEESVAKCRVVCKPFAVEVQIARHGSGDVPRQEISRY